MGRKCFLVWHSHLGYEEMRKFHESACGLGETRLPNARIEENEAPVLVLDQDCTRDVKGGLTRDIEGHRKRLSRHLSEFSIEISQLAERLNVYGISSRVLGRVSSLCAD